MTWLTENPIKIMVLEVIKLWKKVQIIIAIRIGVNTLKISITRIVNLQDLQKE